MYRVGEDERNLIAKDGVTISAKEVFLEQNCPNEWRTFCKAKPVSVCYR